MFRVAFPRSSIPQTLDIQVQVSYPTNTTGIARGEELVANLHVRTDVTSWISILKLYTGLHCTFNGISI